MPELVARLYLPRGKKRLEGAVEKRTELLAGTTLELVKINADEYHLIATKPSKAVEIQAEFVQMMLAGQEPK